ncbi:hypothetical protein E5S70_30230 [Ensifer adhaerens]|uniref:hypothetical protein n=1 Tax=Ensifer canadensis TaxID=555315 RepID=UPI00148FBF7B|nr:hypothetical protein [Ensifer canadensis]NOV20285.1 hypothetical protein [Ensifer canadensis]
MQTISTPYRCSDEDRLLLSDLRRLQSSAIRTAYANALAADGSWAKEMGLRNLVKARFIREGPNCLERFEIEYTVEQ